jgi:hypothetical protein
VEQRIQLVTDVTGLLESLGVPGLGAARAALGADQRFPPRGAPGPDVERGLLARALWPFPRYVNSVLFLPRGQIPSAAGTGTLAGHVRA